MTIQDQPAAGAIGHLIEKLQLRRQTARGTRMYRYFQRPQAIENGRHSIIAFFERRQKAMDGLFQR